jgi:dTDP-4-amino-4,6-dideoxygalactose transaminase
MVKQLEAKLCEHLSVDSLSVFANGTIALSIACRLLNLSGEVITTPFTFLATVNVLAWNQITRVFCDIEKNTYNKGSPPKSSRLSRKKNDGNPSGHVFGNPSDVDRIERLADLYGLKVLYDAATRSA